MFEKKSCSPSKVWSFPVKWSLFSEHVYMHHCIVSGFCFLSRNCSAVGNFLGGMGGGGVTQYGCGGLHSMGVGGCYTVWVVTLTYGRVFIYCIHINETSLK